MRFMMMVKVDERAQAAAPPGPELFAAIGRLTEEMMRAGVVVDTGGLAPTATGVRIRVSGGEVLVTDGPFAEAKEVVGGYAILEVASREEAIEHGRRFMALHRDVLGPSYEGELEIRQLFGPAG